MKRETSKVERETRRGRERKKRGKKREREETESREKEKALRCRGLQWWRWRQLHWKEVEKDKLGWPSPTAFQNLQVGGHGGDGGFQTHWKCRRFVGISPEQHGMATSRSKSCELGTLCEIWEEPCRGAAKCLGYPSASGMVWIDADGSWWRRLVPFGVESWSRHRKWTFEREGLRARGLVGICYPSLYQTTLDPVWMSSWYVVSR